MTTVRMAGRPKAVADEVYQKVSKKSELIKKQYIDLALWLPGDILLKADKMSMAHSLELRVPYLDKKMMKNGAGHTGPLQN